MATAFDTRSFVVLTGYQTRQMVAYPQHTYIDISSHGPCGMKIECPDCLRDAESHDPQEILHIIESNLN